MVGETWEGWTAPDQAIARSPHADLIERVDRYVTDTELTAYFERADAVVLPYHRSSSSGPLQIAMSAGLPVVVTAVGGLVGGGPGLPWRAAGAAARPYSSARRPPATTRASRATVSGPTLLAANRRRLPSVDRPAASRQAKRRSAGRQVPSSHGSRRRLVRNTEIVYVMLAPGTGSYDHRRDVHPHAGDGLVCGSRQRTTDLVGDLSLVRPLRTDPIGDDHMNKPLRILQVSDFFEPFVGGMEQHVKTLSARARSAGSRGNSCDRTSSWHRGLTRPSTDSGSRE